MVSAGLDTVPANIIQGLAYLATPHGQQLQEIAFKELIETYGTPSEAWNAVLKEEKVAFISALVKETLRYYTVIAMSLPRASIKSIKYQGATIPAGTLFYMNARGADFDPSRFSDPYTFNPDRYLEEKSVCCPSLYHANLFRPANIKELLNPTTPTVLDLACARDLISLIGNFMSLFLA